MTKTSLQTAENLLKEMEAYYVLGLQFSSEIQQHPFEDLMRSWKRLEALAVKCEANIEKLENDPVEDVFLKEKLLEQAQKNSNLMSSLSKSLEEEKEKVVQELSKLSSIRSAANMSSNSSFQTSL